MGESPEANLMYVSRTQGCFRHTCVSCGQLYEYVHRETVGSYQMFVRKRGRCVLVYSTFLMWMRIVSHVLGVCLCHA